MTDGPGITRAEIRAVTEARLTFGARGRALETGRALGFALDHAKARAAVLSEIDTGALGAALARAGLTHHVVTSEAATRDTYIRRPDLGRLLPEAARTALPRPAGGLDVALVLGDGLSATAVQLNGVAFVAALAARLQAEGLRMGPVILARQARVALGDGIAQAMEAETVVMALGERPGLSASDSLGVYITHRPEPQTPDSARNCISNIREAGTGVEDAAEQALRLILAMRRLGESGVALSRALGRVALHPAQTPRP